MEAPRPSVRYQRLRGSDSEEAAEPVVSVLLYSRSMRGVIREKHRETCVRIFTALLLLAVALSFAFYQLTHGSVAQQDPEEEKWAFVDDADWNNTWESDSERHQHGKEGKTGYDEENERGHHHDEEEEAGHHHGDEEEPGHNHEEEEQSDEPPAGHTHEHGVYQHATVITDSEICSSVGKGILTAGGNIVDAGISALLCLGVVHPHTAGIESRRLDAGHCRGAREQGPRRRKDGMLDGYEGHCRDSHHCCLPRGATGAGEGIGRCSQKICASCDGSRRPTLPREGSLDKGISKVAPSLTWEARPTV